MRIKIEVTRVVLSYALKVCGEALEFTHHVSLTLKGPLSVWGTNGILGRYLRPEFVSYFFKTSFEDRKN